MKINKKIPRHWWLLLLQGLHTAMVILARPFLRKSRRALIILYGHQFAGNLRALYLAAKADAELDIQLKYLALDPEQAEKIASTGVDVLRCHRTGDMLQLSRASALITDHGLHLMQPLVRFSDIKCFDVWHGIPFKGFTPRDFQPLHNYDESWVSSPLLKTLYIQKFGFSPEKVHSTGYARTDRLFSRPVANACFRKQFAVPEDRKIILYAPTWQQDEKGRELFPFGLEQVAFLKLLEDLCQQHNALLVIRSHQNAHIPAQSEHSNHLMYCSQQRYEDTEDLLLATDILICDWSSIAFDFLALDRPTLFLEVPSPFKNGFSLGPEYRFGHIVNNAPELQHAVATYLSNPEAYTELFAQKHREVSAAVYGQNSDGKSAQRQLARLQALI